MPLKAKMQKGCLFDLTGSCGESLNLKITRSAYLLKEGFYKSLPTNLLLWICKPHQEKLITHGFRKIVSEKPDSFVIRQ